MADKTKIKIELDWGRTKDELKSVEKRISAIGERIASVRKNARKKFQLPKRLRSIRLRRLPKTD